MEDAEIVDHIGDLWVVTAECEERQFYLKNHQIILKNKKAQIGLKGRIGYIQGSTSMTQVFIATDLFH